MLPKNLLCFSPIRWDYIMRRPQQLLVRFAENTNVYFFEEPVFDALHDSYLTYSTRSETLWKVVPHLPLGLTMAQIEDRLARLLDHFLEKADLDKWIFWYYSQTALSFTKNHKPRLVIYDRINGQDHYTDWNAVYLAVSRQILSKLSVTDSIAIVP